MISSLPELLHTVLAVIVPSVTIAAQSLLLPIPQDVSYRAMASGQISNGNFSTEVVRAGRVAADVIGSCSDGADNDGNNAIDCGDSSCIGPLGCDPLGIEAPPARLDVKLIRTPTCVLSGDLLTYRIVITNVGGRSAVDIETQNQHPIMPIANAERPTDQYFPDRRLMIWREPILAPGDTITYTFQIPHVLDRVRDDLTVIYFDRLSPTTKIGPFIVKTYDFAADPCPAPIAGESPPLVSYSPLPSAKPVIICDPSESTCIPSRPTNLGINFNKARSAIDSPNLGARFQEAIADIIPGECRVIPDDIIASPEYHDALSRQADVSALFMRPLYNSGEDFKQLVHENSLLGITNFMYMQERLREIHSRHWNKQFDPLEKVLKKQLSTNNVRGRIDDWTDAWVRETKRVQESFVARYARMQQEKKNKFAPVARRAIANAKLAVKNACPRTQDDGLTPLLPPVQKVYEASLLDRTEAFKRMQEIFANPNTDVVPEENKARTWQTALRTALDAFDKDDPEPLKAYIASIPIQDQQGFEVAWLATYAKHQLEDEKADDLVRINNWEIALDTPKTVATDCQKEKDFKYQVATTWCESGFYPPLLIKGAPVPAKAKSIVLPDTRALDGTKARINPLSVAGEACGKNPGDPWWASDCSCECGDLVPRDGPDPDNPIFVPCESVRRITRHDYYVTTQAECLNDGVKHSDLFF